MRLALASAVVVACLSLLARAETPAVRGFRRPALTATPYTYCIDYRAIPTAPDYLRGVAASPPDLFHLGYHIPFKGALGPTDGHELFTNDLLPPAQIPREAARVRTVIARMRAAGVSRLIPYVYSMAFFGDPRKRTGFFRFYDHWDAYRGYGLGPKPAADPATWQQDSTPGRLGTTPEGTLHYQPCVNNPAWSRYLDLVVRELARCGYDGMFFDVNTQKCHCRYCNALFRAYLRRTYGSTGLRRAFGVTSAGRLRIPTIYGDFEKTITAGFRTHLERVWQAEGLDATLALRAADAPALDEDWRLLRCYMQGSRGEYPPDSNLPGYLLQRFGGATADAVPDRLRPLFVQTVLRYHFHRYLRSPELAAELRRRFGSAEIRRRCCRTPRDLLLWVETQRFWADSMARTFARLKRVGRSVLASRGRRAGFYTVANAGSMGTLDGDNKRRVSGIDIVRWAPSADLQMLEEMQQCGTLAGGGILSNYFGLRWAEAAGTRAAPLLYGVRDERAADLAEAEIAANGGGAFIQPHIYCPESRKRWRQFFRAHSDLWRNGTSAARVGIAYFHDQMYYENTEHAKQARRLAATFAENQVPFDMVPEENLRGLDRYDVLVAPALQYLSRASADALLAYARRGGRLVVIGPFRTHDEFARPVAGGLRSAPRGHARVLILASTAVPRRAWDYWNMMEERANAFVRAQRYMDESRREAVTSGEDRGERFVARLESALGTRLRWCPRGTPPGVYVAAYRLRAAGARSERIVLHLVNYDLPVRLKDAQGDGDEAREFVLTTSGSPVPAKSLTIDVPGTSAWRRMRSSRATTPTEAPAATSVRLVRGRTGHATRVTVDRCTTYQAVVLEAGR